MKKKLITGASGFIGGYLIQHLQKLSPRDQLLSVGSSTHGPKGFVHRQCDLVDSKKLTELFSEFPPDEIYHLAGHAQVADNVGMPEYFNKNFLTTQSIAEAASELKKPVGIFFSSSVHVYGNQPGLINESCDAQPVTPYGFTKYLAEQALKNQAKNHRQLRIAVARLTNCVGPGQPRGFVASDLCYKIAHLPADQAQPDLEVGSLSGHRTFLDVRDAVSLFPTLLAAADQSQNFQIFNVSSPYNLQISEALSILLKIAGKNPAVKSTSSQPPNRFAGLTVSVKRLEETIPNLTFRPIGQTLRDMYQFALNQMPSK